jgi:hypothetical protein
VVKKVWAGGLIFLFWGFSLWAEPEVKTSTVLTLQASTRPEAKLGITGNFTFPLLQGEGPLTAGNNLNLALTADLTPISINGSAEAVLTPIAFLQAVAGGRIGSGWNIALFGNDIYGIGINRPKSDGDQSPETAGSAFDGLLWSLWGGGVFQFDLAALFPGDWNHVVFRSYHEGRYKGYTAASAGDSWYFENDDGQNRNGFLYYGNFLLGYQMPIFLNTVGLMAEAEKYLYRVSGGDAWGDDLARWTLGGLFNFTITDTFSAALIVQFRTRRNYVQGTEDDLRDIFYQKRRIDHADPRYLSFYRVAAILSYRVR